MKKIAMIMSCVAVLAIPSIASAGDATGGAVAGAGVGAATGFVVGGPVGAAVGAGVGGVAGASAGENSDRHRDRVIVEERAPAVTERNCARDSYGNETCTTIRR